MSGFVSILLLGTVVMAISNSRYEKATASSSNMILRYLGETYPNIGYVYWNNVKQHPMGKMAFSKFYELIDEDFSKKFKTRGLAEGHEFWGNYTGVPVLYFKTGYCAMYIEFNAILGFVVIVFVSMLMRWYVNSIGKKYRLMDIALVYFYFLMMGCHSIFGSVIGSLKNTVIALSICIVAKNINILFAYKSCGYKNNVKYFLVRWKMLDKAGLT